MHACAWDPNSLIYKTLKPVDDMYYNESSTRTAHKESYKNRDQSSTSQLSPLSFAELFVSEDDHGLDEHNNPL